MPYLVGYVTPQDYGAAGDGTIDDTPAFQAALTAINTAGGGVLMIPPGLSYRLNGTLHVGPNTTINAYGATLFVGAGADMPLLDNYLNQTAPTVYNGNSNITVLGGVWDAKGQVYTTDSADTIFFGHASNITCRDMHVRNTRNFHGIEYNAINNGQILGCRFEGYNAVTSDPGEAIQIDVAIAGAGAPADDGTECTNITIDDCYAGPALDGSGLGAPGALAGAHSAQGGNSYQVIRVSNSTADTCLHYGIHAYNWAKCEITACTVINSGDVGILVDAQTTGGYQPDSITVTGNSITGATNYGIYVNGGGAFASNYVADISITGNTIRNITTGAPIAGIGVTYAQGATVSGNTIYNCTADGIVCSNNSFLTIEANTVHTCNTGVSIGGCTQVQINGNNLINGTGNGIFLGQTAGLVNTSDVIVDGNVIENFTNAQVRGGTSATDVLVVGNKLTKGVNGAFGVELVSTNTGWSVYDNWLDGSWTLGNALSGFTGTTKVTTWPDGRYGTRGTNTWGTQLDPRLTTATAANTTTETVIGTFTIPANDAQTGGVYRATVYGTASSTGTPTITLKVRLGGVTGVVLASFSAITTASSVTNGGWFIETRLMCLTSGTTATWSASSTLNQQIVSPTTAATTSSLTNGTITANSTTNQALVVTAAWSTASASNTAGSTAGLLYRDY